MVYALLIEDLKRKVDAYTTAAALAVAMGREVEPAEWAAVRDEFDAELAAPPDRERPEWNTPRAVELRALGLR